MSVRWAARHLNLSVRRYVADDGSVVMFLKVYDCLVNTLHDVRYWVSSPAPCMVGYFGLDREETSQEETTRRALNELEAILGPLDFRRRKSTLPPPRALGVPESPADRRARRALAFRLALDARDALTAEVIALRDRVAELESRVYSAERDADIWQGVAQDLQERGAGQIGMTQDGHIGVLRQEH